MAEDKPIYQNPEHPPTMRAGMLTPFQGMVLWIVGLLFFASMTLLCWEMVLGVFTEQWQANYGDRSVRIDPTTHGIPLIISAAMGFVSLLILLRLLVQPLWRRRKLTRKRAAL